MLTLIFDAHKTQANLRLKLPFLFAPRPTKFGCRASFLTIVEADIERIDLL